MFSLARQRARSFLRITLLLASPLLVGDACSVINTDHCGNQEGNATCLQRDPNTPYCSICVADNDGCLAEDPGSLCLAETAPATSVDPTTTTSPTTTTTAEPTTTGTVDPTTGTTTPDPSTDTTQTSEPTDTSTSTPDPTTGTTSTSSSTGETTTTGPDTESSSGDTTMSSSDSESSSTGDLCGNNMIDGDEVCDGTDVNEQKCWTLLPDKWGGGTLKCNNCSSFNDTDCCIGVGQKCDPLKPAEACCGGLKCKAAELLVNRCQN
jgi:hypothetical protein